MIVTRSVAVAAAVLVSGRPLLTVCTDNNPSAGDLASCDPEALTVTATGTACEVSAVAAAPSGSLLFSIANTGSKVNEFSCSPRTVCGSSTRSRVSDRV